MTNETRAKQHTPGPWSVTGQEIYSMHNDARIATVWAGRDSQGMLNKAIGAAEADRNAAFIVEACNAYESLRQQNAELIRVLRRFDKAMSQRSYPDLQGIACEATAILATVQS